MPEAKLLGLKDVSFVKSKGVFIGTPFFNARFLINKAECIELHLCVVCPKKFFKKAVLRNKVKRRMKAAFYEALKQTEVAGIMKVSLLPFKNVLEVNFEQLVSEASGLIRKAVRGKR